MSIDLPIVHVAFSDRFKRDIRRLSKRNRQIRLDIQPLIEQLESGKLLGDQIPDTGYTVFKVRVRNSSTQKDKSGGYRIIYYLKNPDQILLVHVIPNTEQSDITATEIREILILAEAQLPNSENITD
ncbi:MAG: type II toxin-antitoxin system RelE/ParE family toxin [Coleofasciculaceae cyanobacterium SM2_1_6]|nr:type II toxin-antitoxin system RelE/ParE family toxin [Coleofasciculaceae cyanobacterium SM2_1_6]